MNNVTPMFKKSKIDSPKTPGGISKSLLTPCRRLGLSRNWKKAGPSPFVSPLSSNGLNNAEVIVEKRETRKRKAHVREDDDEEKVRKPAALEEDDDTPNIPTSPVINDFVSTPSRCIETLPKKTKLLKSLSKGKLNVENSVSHCAITNADERRTDIDLETEEKDETVVSKTTKLLKTLSKKKRNVENSVSVPVAEKCANNDLEAKEKDELPKRTKLLKTLSKGKINIESSESVSVAERHTDNDFESKEKDESEQFSEAQVVATQVKSKTKIGKHSPKATSDVNDYEKKDNCKAHLGDTEDISKSKTKSPQELTKECIVVIQKKIFKTNKSKRIKTDSKHYKENMKNSVSQALFDSDSDDVPLINLNKNETTDVIEQSDIIEHKPNIDKNSSITENDVILIDDDEDFVETKVKKLEHGNTSTGSPKSKQKKPNNNLKLQKNTNTKPSIPLSQSSNSFDEDDDFEVGPKKTILIRKCYGKISKPSKAKSTGSITQKDIDTIRARIEMKKKLLLAKAMTNDTEELRGLVKKWQTGCQNALMELMELMKVKFLDKQNMDYSEMLEMLRIPPALVGYDSENDCFVTPDDASIILSKFNNL